MAGRGAEFAFRVGWDAELGGKQKLMVDAFALVVGEAHIHIVTGDLTLGHVAAAPIFVRVVEDRMAEMGDHFFRPRMEIVLVCGADVLLVV